MLAGCAGSQKLSVPDWEMIPRGEQEVADATELTILCEVPWTEAECWGYFEQYEIQSEGNLKIANANAAGLRAAYGAFDELWDAGKMQQEYAELREEMLEAERRDHAYDNWFYRGTIVLLGGLAIALGN